MRPGLQSGLERRSTIGRGLLTVHDRLVVELIGGQDLRHMRFEMVDKCAHLGRGFAAKVGKAVLNVRRKGGVDLAVHEAVAAQSLQGLSEHLLADTLDSAQQRVEAHRACVKASEDQHAPAPGDVLERGPRRATAGEDIELQRREPSALLLARVHDVMLPRMVSLDRV